MKLSEALPPHVRGLPVPLSEDELAGLRRVLTSGRVSNYRLVDYVCGSPKRSHRLAEVVAAPEGTLLIVHGLSGSQAVGDVSEPWNVEITHLYRARRTVMRLRDLDQWQAAFGHLSGARDDVSCRCGRHGLDLWRVQNDVDERRSARCSPEVAQR